MQIQIRSCISLVREGFGFITVNYPFIHHPSFAFFLPWMRYCWNRNKKNKGKVAGRLWQRRLWLSERRDVHQYHEAQHDIYWMLWRNNREWDKKITFQIIQGSKQYNIQWMIRWYSVMTQWMVYSEWYSEWWNDTRIAYDLILHGTSTLFASHQAILLKHRSSNSGWLHSHSIPIM